MLEKTLEVRRTGGIAALIQSPACRLHQIQILLPQRLHTNRRLTELLLQISSLYVPASKNTHTPMPMNVMGSATRPYRRSGAPKRG